MAEPADGIEEEEDPVSRFINITHCDRETALFLLEATHNDFDAALTTFFGARHVQLLAAYSPMGLHSRCPPTPHTRRQPRPSLRTRAHAWWATFPACLPASSSTASSISSTGSTGTCHTCRVSSRP